MDPTGEASWAEEELVLISALEHWSYCPRQCALIHLEQTYDENLYTLRGNRAHQAADEAGVGTERGVRLARAVPLWSDRLGLTGRADVVEFHPAAEGAGETPYPVEYKAGSRREWGHEALQLCAQGLCLEEMLGVAVPAGAIWYHASRRRREVRFDAGLRGLVAEATAAVRAMLAGERLPAAPNDARCPKCSLFDACLPGLAASPARVRGYQGSCFGWRTIRAGLGTGGRRRRGWSGTGRTRRSAPTVRSTGRNPARRKRRLAAWRAGTVGRRTPVERARCGSS